LGAGRRHPLFTLRKPWPQNGITSPTPYTLSPLLKGGEGRGEEGSYTHVPCLFGALLVTLYQLFSKGVLNGRRDIGSGASPRWGLAAPQKETLYQEMV